MWADNNFREPFSSDSRRNSDARASSPFVEVTIKHVTARRTAQKDSLGNDRISGKEPEDDQDHKA